MANTILRYILYWPLNILSVVVAYILAPIAALPVFVTTTPPKGAYGNPRVGEWLVQFWAWITTHDAHVDSGRVDNYFTVPDSAWGRYKARVLWIWRNPAYYFKHHVIGIRASDPGAFLYERRFKYLHVQFGWKLYRNDPDGKRMYAFRIKPELKEGWS